MNLESQVITLQQAKRLKELGVKQDGIFNHFVPSKGEPCIYPSQLKVLTHGEYFTAFTCAELGEMLPPITEHLERFANWQWNGFQQGYDYIQLVGNFSTEAEARGAMLIHLIENKLITVERQNY